MKIQHSLLPLQQAKLCQVRASSTSLLHPQHPSGCQPQSHGRMMLPWYPDSAQPALPHLHTGKGKLAHGQVKQQDVFLASFFISRAQTRW